MQSTVNSFRFQKCMSTKKCLLGAWKMPAWFYIGLSVRVRYYQASTVNFDLRQLSVEVLPIIQKFKNSKLFQ